MPSKNKTSMHRVENKKRGRRRAETPRKKSILIPPLLKGAVALTLIGVAAPGFASPDTSRTADTTEVTVADVERAVHLSPSVVQVAHNTKTASFDRASFTAKKKPTPVEKRSTSLMTVADKSSETVKEEEKVVSQWVSPIPGAKINSSFGHRGAIAAAGTVAGLHNGIDLGAPMDSPIHAAFDGEVVHVGYTDFDTHTGGVVVVLHKTEDGDYLSSYNHMKTSGILVEVGDQVKSGETIARVGSEGKSSGPHLHFSVRKVTGPDVLKDWELLEPQAFLQSNGVII